MPASSPFPLSSSKPGRGEVQLSLLPPSIPSFSTLSYTYPLKLIPSIPHILPDHNGDGTASHLDGKKNPTRVNSVPLLFLLTYGGGLLPKDNIHLNVKLEAWTRLAIATQGSTKIYKSSALNTPASSPAATLSQSASQTLSVHLGPHSALLYLPHPTQPFAESRYRQDQIFTLGTGASLATIDWVSCGREARGERWMMEAYRSRTEVWTEGEQVVGIEQKNEDDPHQPSFSERKLLLRDNVLLEPSPSASENYMIPALMEPFTLIATLILTGPVFASLSAFFLHEFSLLPRIGARGFDTTPSSITVDGAEKSKAGERQAWRQARWVKEKRDGILWTAASVRDDRAVVVRFGSRDCEVGRRWIKDMVDQEGSLVEAWGKGATGGLS